ncbi:probable E3 ubiquitin-protein ligase makorin-2, partial [Limulus polyphemus]|uniref:RING-type E3 ubiquitin transferase n=1 Tax=Limulus polyphemus TaxID=6850 RepID=A0ABM1BP28_LIMPO
MAEGGFSGILCRYFANGICREGSSCPFSHDQTLGRPDTICRYYLQGRCAFNNRCRYDHINLNRSVATQNQPVANATNCQSGKYSGHQSSESVQGPKHAQSVTPGTPSLANRNNASSSDSSL